MSTKTELELRPLEDDEVERVSGGSIPVQQQAQFFWTWADAPSFNGAGPFKFDAMLYTGQAWNWYSANVLGGASTHLSLPAGLH